MTLSAARYYDLASRVHLDALPRAFLMDMVRVLEPHLKDIGSANRDFLNSVAPVVRAGHGEAREPLRQAVEASLDLERTLATLSSVKETYFNSAPDSAVLLAARLVQRCVLISSWIREGLGDLSAALS